MAACRACSARLSELRQVRSMLAAVPPVEPRRSFRVREADVRGPVAPRRQPFVLRAMPALSAAAVFVFGIAVALDLRGDSGDAGMGGLSAQGDSRAYDSADSPPYAESSNDGFAADADPDKATGDPTAPSASAAARDGETIATAPAPATGGGAAPAPQELDDGERVDAFTDDGDDGNNSALRIVEIIAGATALAAAAIALVAWRQRKGAAAHGPT